MPHRRAVIFAAILALVVALDQGSKAWARTLPVSPAGCDVPADLIAHRCGGVPESFIAGFWEWELAFNTGAAFSSFRGAQLLLGLLACGALIALGFMAWRARPEQRLRRIALAIIAGGALGNLIDRVRDSAVTDFIRWRVGEARWPIFNIADAALLVGVVLLFLEGLAEQRRARATASAPA
ncbi:MAG TPA: signal peptidase II [Kofleriaceae bacterium]|nr:signal peptidase II [Kofleriaceae bacterium]